MATLEEKATSLALRSGNVSEEEIKRVMLGDELIKVTHKDLEDLFDINSFIRRIAYSFTPIIHSSNVANLIGITTALGIVSTLIAVLTPVNYFASLYAEAVGLFIMSLVAIGGIIADDNDITSCIPFYKDTPIRSMLSIFMSAFVGIGSILGIIYGPTVGDSSSPFLWGIAFAAVATITLVLAKVCIDEMQEFAHQAIKIDTFTYSISRSAYKTNADIKHAVELFIQKHNIPKSIGYSLLNHAETGNYTSIKYAFPKFDGNAYDLSIKMKRELAKDPAVLLCNSHSDYLVGAWDIEGDHKAITEQIKAENSVIIDSNVELASRLGSNAKTAILKAIKEKTNRLERK